MKILFGAGNWLNSNIQLNRILSYNSNHEIKIAAFYRNHKYLNCINWCLDPIFLNPTSKNRLEIQTILNKENVPGFHYKPFELMFNEVADWQPDLIISDYDLVTSHIAEALKIPLWYCSSLLLNEALQWDKKFNDAGIHHFFKNLPIADKYLIYSPFGDIINCPAIKDEIIDKFYWVQPYAEIPDDIILISDEIRLNDNSFKSIARMARNKSIFLTSGETSFIADSLYSGFNIIVSPDPNDSEQCLNADLVRFLQLGLNIGKAEIDLNYAKNKLDEYLHKRYQEEFIVDPENYNPQLHDFIGDYETSCSV